MRESFWLDNKLTILTATFLFIILVLLVKEATKKATKSLIICPLRGKRIKKYDSKGNYTEEYQRIRLINYFIRQRLS